jgi:hypothetical protein
VVLILDDTIDVSLLLDISEEEEEEKSEKNKELEVLFEENAQEIDYFASIKEENKIGYLFKNYQKLHFNVISPPPDLI